jgi:hypothetical protein
MLGMLVVIALTWRRAHAKCPGGHGDQLQPHALAQVLRHLPRPLDLARDDLALEVDRHDLELEFFFAGGLSVAKCFHASPVHSASLKRVLKNPVRARGTLSVRL